jgi:hypothetical protein
LEEVGVGGIEEVLFVERNIVLGEELDVFIMRGDLLMMFLLACNVSFCLGADGFAHGEGTVSRLPCESGIMVSSGFQPFAAD